MKKKIFIQIILIFLIFYFSYFLYNKYFYKDLSEIKLGNEKSINEKSINEKSINENTNMNMISKINYKSSDMEGRIYNITAESGYMDLSNSQVIKMNKVTANIKLDDGNLVTITSDFADYNSITYETKFNSNVVSEYLEHKIFSELLIIDFDKNILEATNKMTYKNPNTIMKADKLKVDLLTKDIKISNFDEKVGSNINKNVEIEFSNK